MLHNHRHPTLTSLCLIASLNKLLNALLAVDHSEAEVLAQARELAYAEGGEEALTLPMLTLLSCGLISCASHRDLGAPPWF